MAYEDGNSVFNYFLETLQYYVEDNSIFLKAAQIIESLKATVAYPFNLEVLNNTTREILGVGLYDMARCAGWFLHGDLTTNLDEFEDAAGETAKVRAEIEAIPEVTRNRFLRELRAFCLTYRTLMWELWEGSAVGATEKLDSVHIAVSADDRKDRIVRFVRADKQYFDILFTPGSARQLAKTMTEISDGGYQ